MTSAYQQQLAQQLRAAEDELSQWRTYGRRAERYRAAWLSSRRRAAESRSSHDTHEAAAQRWANDLARLGHDQLKRAEQAEARIAAVRALASKLATDGEPWAGSERAVGEQIIDTLDAPTDPRSPGRVLAALSESVRIAQDCAAAMQKLTADLHGHRFAVTVTPGVAQTPWGVIVPTPAEEQAPRTCEPNCNADDTDPDHIHDPECGSTNAVGVRRCTRPADHDGYHLNDDGHDWDSWDDY